MMRKAMKQYSTDVAPLWSVKNLRVFSIDFCPREKVCCFSIISNRDAKTSFGTLAANGHGELARRENFAWQNRINDVAVPHDRALPPAKWTDERFR